MDEVEIDLNSRVFNIDTHKVQNFLKNSHKRTKKTSKRYFGDERLSLPQISKVGGDKKKSVPFLNKRTNRNGVVYLFNNDSEVEGNHHSQQSIK